MDGVYDSRVTEFYLIDCRFEYEYQGGHIAGAININTTNAVEEYFLGPDCRKPKPTISADPCKKPIIVFHCEFSQERAPTLYAVCSSGIDNN